MAVAMMGCALAEMIWMAAAAFVVAGIGFTMALTSVSVLVQERVAPSMRGRVMAWWMIGFLGSLPDSAAAAGAVSDLLGVSAAFAIMAVALGAVVALCPPRRLA